MTFTIPAGHPSMPGHFPGNPLVPGVVLLDEILARLPPAAILDTAKFTAPVRFGETVGLSWTEAAGRIAFTASVAGGAVLRGTARL